MIFLDSLSQTVVKSVHEQENEKEIVIEKDTYERFRAKGGHPGILNYYGPFEHGIRLQYAPEGDLADYLASSNPHVNQRPRWCQNIAAAVDFVHSNNVIHGDLKCGNILLDTQLGIKLGDFGGSSLDWSPLLVEVTASHRSPEPTLCVQGDLFALGSTMYQIMNGVAPFALFEEVEIRATYAQSKFADTIELGPIG